MSSNISRLEAHVGFFRLLMNGGFGPYVLWPFDKKLIFSLKMRIRIRNYKVVHFLVDPKTALEPSYGGLKSTEINVVSKLE